MATEEPVNAATSKQATIGPFVGPYSFLLNSYPAPVKLDGEMYANVEAAYSAARTEDESVRKAIREARTPSVARRIGRAVPKHWWHVSEDTMVELLRQKFAPGTELAERLLATGDAQLVNRNLWDATDTFWGVYKDRGENQLGVLLMQVRRELHAYLRVEGA